MTEDKTQFYRSPPSLEVTKFPPIKDRKQFFNIPSPLENIYYEPLLSLSKELDMTAIKQQQHSLYCKRH